MIGRLFRVFVCFFVLTWTLRVEAASSRVRIVVSEHRDPLLEEALVRIRAELEAVGFEVIFRVPAEISSDASALGPEEQEAGALELFRGGGELHVHAIARGLDAPLTQSIRARDGMTAEVVAVRAVEVLRAAMIQSVRSQPPSGGEEWAEPIERFTHLERPRAEPLPSPAPVAVASEEPDAVDAPTAWHFIVEAGVMARLPATEASGAVGGELRLSLEKSWFRAGVWLDSTIAPSVIDSDAGTIRARDLSVLARAGSVLGDAAGWQWQAGVGAGVAHLWFDVDAAPGFRSASGAQTSALLQLDSTLGFWVTERAGPYCSARLGVLLDAAVVRIEGEEVARWGRPSLTGSCGAQLRF